MGNGSMKKTRRQRAKVEESSNKQISPIAIFAAISAFALMVRLLYLWQIRHAPFFTLLMGDSRGYDQWARRIADGDWIGTDVFYQAPLYPYFMGAIYTVAGHDVLAVRLCQAVLGSVSCALIAHAAWRLFSRRAGIIAGFILALYAPAIFFDGLVQKTALDAFLTCLAIWIISGLIVWPVTSWRSWMALGATMGALSLTRENALILIAVIGVWCLSGWRLEARGWRLEARGWRLEAGGSGARDSGARGSGAGGPGLEGGGAGLEGGGRP